MFKYPGPTLLLFRTTTGTVYGAAIDKEWEDNVGGWGGSDDCKVFLLHPTLQIVKDNAKVSMNIRGRSAPKGVAISPDLKKVSLWIENGAFFMPVSFFFFFV